MLALLLLGGCSLLTFGDDDASTTEESSASSPLAAVAQDSPPAPMPAAAPIPTAGALSAAPLRAATRVERIAIEPAGEGARVIIGLDGNVEPEVSLLVNHRLVLDLPGTTCDAVPRVVEGGGNPLVERVRTAQHAAPSVKSRVVIDLRSRADFAVRPERDRIVVLLAAGGSGGALPNGDAGTPGDRTADARPMSGAAIAPAGLAPAAAGPASSAEPVPAPASTPEPLADAVEATRAPSAAAAEIAPPPLAEPATTPAPGPAVAVADASPAARSEDPALERSATLDAPSPTLLAAPTPAAAENAAGPTVRGAGEQAAGISSDGPPATDAGVAPEPTSDAAPSGSTPESALREDVAATPEPLLEATAAAPAAAAEAPAPSPAATVRTKQGKRISIDFTETDVRTVIELIAAAGGYSVIFTPDVGGVITVTLIDRPWEYALDTVLRAKRLREVRHEDVMLVSPVTSESDKPRRTAP